MTFNNGGLQARSSHPLHVFGEAIGSRERGNKCHRTRLFNVSQGAVGETVRRTRKQGPPDCFASSENRK
jgi:hypothetical protein